MTKAGVPMVLRDAAEEFVEEAVGRSHRDDAVLDRTGGPAGNARLTAWTGLLLLVLFLAELVTLLDVHGLLSWHVVIGVLLVPPALLKTASTGWRIVRYYTGNKPYRVSGPPPLILRVLGPLVILSTLAVLGTGVALILLTPATGRHDVFAIAGFGINLLFLHKASFVVWAAATGIHTIGRLIPAVRLTVAPVIQRVPGRLGRTATLSLTVGIAVVVAALALSLVGPWRADHPFGRDRHGIAARLH
jgi:hypothetical protein